MWVLPFGAALVSGLFSALLVRQWSAQHRAHLLAWAAALLMFAAASLAAAIGMLLAWTPTWFRLYYLFGAIVNVPVLGLGTLYLLAPPRVARLAALVVVVGTMVATVVVFATELEPGAAAALATNGIPRGHAVVPSGVRMMARYYSFVGLFVVVGGALWSARRLLGAGTGARTRLVVANLLIAGGTMVVGLGSGFAFYGRGWPFAVGLLVGVSLMFCGFLTTRPRMAGAGSVSGGDPGTRGVVPAGDLPAREATSG